MTRVAPLLELGRSILNEGYSSSEKRVKDEDGNITTETINGTKRGEHYGDRTMSRINDILDDVYGFKAEDLTFEVGGASISITKIGQRLMALTAMNQYMMSVNAAVQNAITAQIQFRVSLSGGSITMVMMSCGRRVYSPRTFHNF